MEPAFTQISPNHEHHFSVSRTHSDVYCKLFLSRPRLLSSVSQSTELILVEKFTRGFAKEMYFAKEF